MRVAIFADDHFDESPGGRFEECRDVHQFIAGDIAQRDVDLALGAGDLYERKSTPRERAAAADFVRAVTEQCPLVMVRGNHDAPGDVKLLERLETRHEVIVEEGAGVHAIGGCVVACLAWPTRAGVLAQAAQLGLGHEGAELIAGDALRAVLRGLGQQKAEVMETRGLKHAPSITLAHAMVRGSKVSAGQPLVGCDFELGLEDIALSHSELYALGHVHCPQDWKIGAPAPELWIYPGSPRRTAFGEVEEKGYVIVDFRDDGTIASWERVPTPCAGMVLLEGEYVAPYSVPTNGGDDAMREGIYFERTGVSETIASTAGAEVRLRYRVEPEYRAGAKAMAEQLKREMLDAGALSVKVEEEVVSITRARAPEVVEAGATEDQVAAMWRARGDEPEEPRRGRLMQLVRDLVAELGGADKRDTSALRWDRIRTRGLGPYREEVDIDLSTLPGVLTAVCGKTGEGKSTLLALLTGALFRQCRIKRGSTKSLAEIATARDAFVEVQVVNGADYTVRQSIDAVSGKGEALVLDAEGRALLESGKVRDFSAWAASHFPSPEVVFTGPVSVQGSAGLLEMPKGDRKAVFLRGLGIEYLERLTSEASKRASTATAEADQLRARLTELETSTPKLEQAKAELAAAEASAEEAAKRAEAARLALQRAKAAAEDAERKAEILGQRDAAKRRKAKAEARIADLDVMLANNRRVLEDRERLEAAVVRAAELGQQQNELRQRRDDLDREHRERETARAQAQREHREVTQRCEALERRAAAARARLQDRPAIEQAARDVKALEATERQLREGIERLEGEAARLSKLQLEGKDQRITGLRTGLATIADGHSDDPDDLASRSLSVDDALANDLEDAPEQLDDAKVGLRAQRAELDEHRSQLRKARDLTAQAPLLEQADTDLAEALTEHEDASGRRDELNAIVAEHAGRLEAIESDQLSCKVELADVDQTLQSVDKDLQRASQLPKAEARVAELEEMLVAPREDLAEAETELAALPDVTIDDIDLGPLQDAMQARERDEANARKTVGVKAARVQAAEDGAERMAELRAELNAVAEQVADWIRLTLDLGRDGLQALLIDAAIPEVNAVANSLLHTCHGPRWTVEIGTEQLSADGKRMLEGMPVRVIDAVRGLDQDAFDYSGGETSIVGEAVALAITQVNCRQGDRPTLIRDETGSQLDAESRAAYVRMLRMAAEAIGADRVLYVSHSDDMQDLADSRIVIEGGRVSVQ